MTYPPVRNAFIDWIAGLAVGFLPLFCHGLLHFTSTRRVDFVENWSVDILFVGIANSGLLLATLLSRTIIKRMNLNPYCVLLGVFNGGLLVVLGVAYGNVAVGQAKDLTVPIALWMLGGSIFLSLLIEISFAMEN